MKRILIASIIPIFLLIACTEENNEKEKLLPTSTTETKHNETNTKMKTETGNDRVLTNAEEAMVFLEKAAEITSKLETISFSFSVFNTSYLNNLDEPEYSSFFDYYSTYEGTMQRNPKLAYITKSIDNSSGTLVNGYKDQYDESSRLAYTNTEYFDPELGWFSVSGDYSYGGVVESDEQEQAHIAHYDIDASFKTLEHIDRFMQLFMSYPDQLSIYKESHEDVALDNWIIELKLTNEQYFEHFNMLEYNLFTGSYFDVDSNELYFVESEKLRDLYLTLMFDPSYNLVQLTVNHTYNALEDYVDANRNDYFTTIYYAFFSDYNLPYTHTIPESVILNANYN